MQQASRSRKKGAKKQTSRPKNPLQNNAEAKTKSRRLKTDSDLVGPEAPFLDRLISNQPILVCFLAVLVPYISYLSMYTVLLRQPFVINWLTLGFVRLRDPVYREVTRQLLVLGSLGSGTEQLATGLSEILDLEVGHEQMDAENAFVRDGTVSSFLGIRFAPKNAERSGYVMEDLCSRRTKGSSFHPKNYVNLNCSTVIPLGSGSKACFTDSCVDLLESELGCGLGTSTCRTPFVRTLYQVQHPVRMLQTLVSKVCPGRAKSVHPSFRHMATVFLDESNSTSCLESVSLYVLNFNEALLAARDRGDVLLFRYEDSSLCDVVKLAGFLDDTGAFYTHLIQKCGQHNIDATKKLPELESRSDERRRLPVLSWDVFQEAGGDSLVERLRSLSKNLGYDPDILPAIVAESNTTPSSKP